MTAVEFYDKTPIENAVSLLTTAPQKIIYIGDGNRQKRFLKRMRTFISENGLKTEIDFRSVKRNVLDNIVEVLSDIVEQEDECVFDLTGGDDLTLVAMGIVFQKYPQKRIQMQRFNINNGKVTDCDNDGNVKYSGAPKISVKDNILLHGGAVRFADNPKKGTCEWEYSPEFLNDLEFMWQICAKEPGYWNARINVLEKAEEFYGEEDSLTVSFTATALKNRLGKKGPKYESPKGLLAILGNKGLVSYSVMNNEEFTVTYKNHQIKWCLTTAGTVLEQKVAITAKSITDENGTPIFNDVLSGVHIDWDGEIHDETDKEKDTKNEIDVIAMCGITPVFISCKNGHIEDEEVYKLETVCNRFGGIYAKKLLVATYIGKKDNPLAYFKKRAEDMDIKLIDNVHSPKFNLGAAIKEAINIE